MKQKNFICHLVQQNLRLQINQTDFKLLYICLFYPRINKIFYIWSSRPSASTLMRRKTALYNIQKKDRCVCVVCDHVDLTNTHQQRETQTYTTSRREKNPHEDVRSVIHNDNRKYTLSRNGPIRVQHRRKHPDQSYSSVT